MIFLVGLATSIQAQSVRAYAGLGGMHHAFQDARFSHLQITGTAPALELGFRYLSGNSYILAEATGNGYFTEQPNSGGNMISSLGVSSKVGYLYGVTPDIYLGGGWRIFDYVIRETEGLHNNSNFFLASSDLLFSARYLFHANSNWSFEIGGDLAALSFMKYAPSFTANLLQKAIDEGEASYQNLDTRHPFRLSYLKVKPLWEQAYIQTHLQAYFRKRISAAYNWNMRTFADQKGYPLTLSHHTLSFRYHFISRPE